MTGIEDAASDLDLSVLRIETGDRQPEAVSLYEGMGWERIFVTAEGATLPESWIRFLKVIG
jgi:hypothetical protein